MYVLMMLSLCQVDIRYSYCIVCMCAPVYAWLCCGVWLGAHLSSRFAASLCARVGFAMRPAVRRGLAASLPQCAPFPVRLSDRVLLRG